MNDFNSIQSSSNIMFTIVPVFIGIVFVLVIGSLLFKGASSVAEWSNNNSLPKLTIPVIVVAKRVETQIHRRHNNHSHSGHSSTSSTNKHIVTFESTTNRERYVFIVNQNEFDKIIEKDRGQLTHQGTRFHDFSRS